MNANPISKNVRQEQPQPSLRVCEKCEHLATVTPLSMNYWIQFSEDELDAFLDVYGKPSGHTTNWY